MLHTKRCHVWEPKNAREINEREKANMSLCEKKRKRQNMQRIHRIINIPELRKELIKTNSWNGLAGLVIINVIWINRNASKDSPHDITHCQNGTF